MKSEVQATQRNVRLELFRIVAASCPTGTAAQTADGCPEGYSHCTVLQNDTGDVTINYNTPFKRKPIVTVSALHATATLYVTLVSSTTSAVRLLCCDDDGVAINATELHVNVAGFDAVDQM